MADSRNFDAEIRERFTDCGGRLSLWPHEPNGVFLEPCAGESAGLTIASKRRRLQHRFRRTSFVIDGHEMFHHAARLRIGRMDHRRGLGLPPPKSGKL